MLLEWKGSITRARKHLEKEAADTSARKRRLLRQELGAALEEMMQLPEWEARAAPVLDNEDYSTGDNSAVAAWKERGRKVSQAGK